MKKVGKKQARTLRARYQQLAADLSGRIKNGHLGPGDQLPSEQELMKSSGLSRITVRQAVGVLARQGLVVRRRGLGTFVAPPRISQEWSELTGFYDLLVAQGIYPETELLDFRRTITSQNVARKLGSKTATLFVKTYSIDQRPIGVFFTYLTQTKGVSEEMVISHRSYELLKVLGRTIACATVSLHAANAGENISRLLRIEPNDPILIVERTSIDPAGKPLEHTVAYVRSDAYEFTFKVTGSVSIANAITMADLVS